MEIQLSINTEITYKIRGFHGGDYEECRGRHIPADNIPH
jgi:hypothetical protein